MVGNTGQSLAVKLVKQIAKFASVLHGESVPEGSHDDKLYSIMNTPLELPLNKWCLNRVFGENCCVKDGHLHHLQQEEPGMDQVVAYLYTVDSEKMPC